MTGNIPKSQSFPYTPPGVNLTQFLSAQDLPFWNRDRRRWCGHTFRFTPPAGSPDLILQLFAFQLPTFRYPHGHIAWSHGVQCVDFEPCCSLFNPFLDQIRRLNTVISSIQNKGSESHSVTDFAKPGSGKMIRIEDVVLSEDEMEHYVDLAPFLNPAPYVVQEHMSLTKVG
jgi:hypothetical protein